MSREEKSDAPSLRESPTLQDTDDLIWSCAVGLEDRGLPSFVPATNGDFVAVCTDADRDRWALFPVAETDERGAVMSIHWQRGTIEPLYCVRKRKPQMLVRSVIITDRPAVRGLCWAEHDGLFDLREAIRPHVSPNKEQASESNRNDGASPQLIAGETHEP